MDKNKLYQKIVEASNIISLAGRKGNGNTITVNKSTIDIIITSIKNRVDIENRDRKIECLLNNKKFIEKKIEDDSEYKMYFKG